MDVDSDRVDDDDDSDIVIVRKKGRKRCVR